MAFDRTKFIGRFVEEAREHIKKLNEGLLILEKNPGDTETMNVIVRSAHTIKGSSRMLKLTAITEVAHKLEDALDALRAGRLQHSKGVFNLIFKAIETISGFVENTAEGEEITTDNTDICEKLEAASTGDFKEEAASPVPATIPEPSPTPGPTTTTEPSTAPGSSTAPVVPEKAEQKEGTDIKETPGDEGPGQKTVAQKTAVKTPKVKIQETIRVSSEKLDVLIKLVGEMISNQSRLKQNLLNIKNVEKLSERNFELISNLEGNGISSNGNNDEIIDNTRTLYQELKQLAPYIGEDLNIQELLIGELQERSLKMRMLPLSTVFDTFPMAVRDIAGSLGKEIDFTITGAETELDKKIIEKIGDPLVHMIRNSIDHGIEQPEVRQAAGKPGTGQIKLSACYEGGNVLVELSDDGGGIALQRLKEKALRKGLYDEETLDNMQESEIVDLIFHHGFSTSAIITDLSGRGVGMGVAKENIVDELKGSIQIKTNEGEGTSFYIRLPLTLAIMRGLLFTISGMTFAVSADSVDEILKIPRTEVIDVVDKKAIRLREQIIPVENTSFLLNLPLGANEDDHLLIIIVHMGNEKMGLIVDSLLDEHDMVIKPLPSHMRNIPLVSGVAISGKNEIINILHIPELIKAAKEAKGTGRLKAMAVEEKKKALNILVVDDSINTREIEKAILESYGYIVTLAGDGIEAMEKVNEFKYDLVITDIEMPRMDGFTFTEKLRDNEEYRSTPIIIVTSREKEEDKKRGIQVGADAYIIKGSFDQSNLLDTIQNLMG
jgi:chemotaxis protein histidine kinase CheA